MVGRSQGAGGATLQPTTPAPLEGKLRNAGGGERFGWSRWTSPKNRPQRPWAPSEVKVIGGRSAETPEQAGVDCSPWQPEVGSALPAALGTDRFSGR